MRILCHAQHLSGVGHFVRMHTIAHGLADAGHEVHLVAGGRPVPRPPSATAIRTVELPALVRAGDRLVAPGAHGAVERTLAERARALGEAAVRIRPDVVLVDHYPFSKWELEDEIAAAVRAARRASPGARIVCSLRDVVARTRHEDAAGAVYDARVLARLGSHFDAVLVHGDPTFTRLGEHFAAADRVPVPVAYTGFVTALPAGGSPAADSRAVLSCGGGADGLPFLLAAIEAFACLARSGALGTMRVEVFAGLALGDAGRRDLDAAVRTGPFEVRDFSPEFGVRLASSRLSVSRAGYNTIADVLRAGVRAVVVPDPLMSDQGPRARRLAALGIATVVEGDPPAPDVLAAAIGRALAAPTPRHALDLGGVATTIRLLEALGTGQVAAWDSTPTSTSRSTPA